MEKEELNTQTISDNNREQGAKGMGEEGVQREPMHIGCIAPFVVVTQGGRGEAMKTKKNGHGTWGAPFIVS